jgi:hypothetical protein
VREATSKYQQTLITERLAETPLESQNMFQPGDFVLFQRNPEEPLPTKLSTAFIGPYEVIEQLNNTVRCQHLALRHEKSFHVERLKLFYGTRDQAFELAMRDGDQHLIDRVLGWKGDPNVRTTMEFDVLFADGDTVRLPWTPDLYTTKQFEEFCEREPILFPLRFSAKDAPKRISELKRAPITRVQPGDTFYLDLRYYGTQWFEELGLPAPLQHRYVVEARYQTWVKVTHGGHSKIRVAVLLYNEILKPWTNDMVILYGCLFERTDEMIVCDRDLVIQYPGILPDASRQTLLETLKAAAHGEKG